ncbi:MAG: ATP-binding protein [Pseudobdellovibrionaceae bacterium]|nr:ATP-binding protein [Pseudobdellovibrionaceae bacterium]
MKKFKVLSRAIWSLDLRVLTLVGNIVLSMAVGSLFLFKRLADQAQSLLFDAMDAMSYAVHHGLATQFYERYYDLHAFSKNPAVQSMERLPMENILNVFVQLYGVYDLILVTDTQGRLVGSSTINPKGETLFTQALYEMDFSLEPWFRAVKQQRGTYVEQPLSDPYLKIVDGRDDRTTTFAAAILDANGKFLGVICIRAGVRWIERELNQAYAMLHAGGFSIARLELIDQGGERLVTVGSHVGDGGFTEVPVTYPGTASKTRSSKIWSMQKSTEGDLIVASSFLADPLFAPSLDWSIRLTVGSSMASRQLADTVRMSYGLILLASVGLLFLSVGYLRRLVMSRLLQHQVDARTAELHRAALDLEERNRDLETNKAELLATNTHLIEAQKELQDTAKRLGQAEVAALTLHNIGNIITSLNIQSSLLHEQMEQDPPGQLALAYLKKIQTSDRIPERMPEFVSRIESAERASFESVRQLLRGLIDNVRMVMSAISSQLAFVQQNEKAEPCPLSELLRHTLILYYGTFKRHHLQQTLQLQHEAVLLTERFRFESILTVLIRNAIDATMGLKERHIRFSTHYDGECLTLAIADNGHGFDADISVRLFHFGFSTKDQGHGFGLHYAMNACQDLGLQLKLESPGTDQGATASLIIPRDRLLSVVELGNLAQRREDDRPNQDDEAGAHPT